MQFHKYVVCNTFVQLIRYNRYTPWALVGPPWALWAPLGPCGFPFGPMWAPLGPLWAPLGPLWAGPLRGGPYGPALMHVICIYIYIYIIYI